MTQKNSGKEINWDFYDTINEFTVSDAVCFLRDVMPNDSQRVLIRHDVFDMPDYIQRLKKAILQELLKLPETHSGMKTDGSEYKVSRQDLVEFANRKGLKPQFFFPEERIKSEPPAPKKKDELDPRRRGTYLKLIKALLTGLELDYKERGVAPKIRKMVEMAGLKLDDKTIQTVVDELDDVIEG